MLASPQVAGVLTRLMCSSFTDGGAAIVVAGPAISAPASAPRIIGSVARSGNGLLDYHDRLTQAADAAWEAWGLGPDDFDLVELHDATAPEEIYALESLGFFGRGEAGPATEAGHTGVDSPGLVVNSERRPGRPRAPARRHRAGPSGRAGHPVPRAGRGAPGRAAPAWAWPSTRAASSKATPASSASTPSAPDPSVTGIRITGWGIALPDKIVTNDDMAASLDTSDAWITERTGIRERRIGGTTSGLAIEAGQNALRSAGRTAAEIDHVVLATTTPDGIVPGTAPTVQNALGIKGGAFDINAACSGFVYGLVTVAGLIADRRRPDPAHRLGDPLEDHRHGRPGHRHHCGRRRRRRGVEPVEGPGQLLSWNLNSDGSLRHLLYCEHGGTLYMDGKEVFRKAVRVVVESAERAMADAGLGPDDVSLLVPHQANLRIIVAACQRLGIPEERTVVVIDRYGNTSSASIPLALHDAISNDRVHDGDNLLLTGFGGGMTWASAVLRWGP